MTELHGRYSKSGERISFPTRSVLALGVVLVFLFSAVVAVAEDDEDSDDKTEGKTTDRTWLEPPAWVNEMSVTGRYVGTPNGSSAKYLEDHNIQSGPIIKLRIEDDILDDGTLFIEGMIEPLQNQGYLLFEASDPEGVTFTSNIQAWREYYNTRTGDAPETVLGTPIAPPPGIFPNTTNSTHFYGGGKPKTDWLRTQTGAEIELPGPFKDAWADFVYRSVDGESSLQKGGTVFDPTAVPPLVGGSGPGTVYFDVSGRKQLDYESIGGLAGSRANLGGVNWQFDLSGMSHELKSTTLEPNFTTNSATSELELYGENSSVKIVTGDLVGSRHLRPDLFVFGGTTASWERSDPDPTQYVQTGIRDPGQTRQLTRYTLGSDVTRFSEAVTGGAVFTPIPTVLIRADASVRASQQEGRLNEERNESAFLAGDIGVILNDSDRDMVSARVRVKGDWRAARRLSIYGLAQYDFRYDNVRTRRILNFVVTEPTEIEDYTNERSQFRAGGSARYRFRKGRTLEGGYEFTWVGFQNDINTLANQFVVSDYDRYRHRIHLKAAGRITRKLRGELRAQYIFEDRELDAPDTQPPDIANGGDGKIEFQGFTIVPVLTYQHSPEWSGVLSASIGRQEYKLVDDGPSPPGFSSLYSDFQYEAFTQTVTVGVNWVPNDMFSNAFSYTVYHNSESVENAGHDASVRSTVAINENWDVEGALRYLSYSPDDGDNTVDDYHTVIVSLGLTGRF